VFIAVLVLVTAVPAFINGMPALFGGDKILFLPGWWVEFFPVTYYVLGAYFRRFPIKFSKVAAFVLVLLAVFGVSSVDHYFSEGGPPHFYGGGYGSLITVLITTLIFYLFYDVRMKNRAVSWVFKYLSSITLEIYLGYIISGVIANRIITSSFPSLTESYNFKVFFLAVPLDFAVSTAFAILETTLIKAVQVGIRKISVKNPEPQGDEVNACD
jgi:surface polysaccharide O-acyltransferase-like enzyme